MTSGFKISKETVTPQKSIGDNLNYNFDYVYDENYAHRLIRAGDRYYKYDANGNIICEQDGSFESNGDDVSYHKITQEAENVYSTDYGWGLFKEDNSSSKIKGSRYCRAYIWNERNQLISSVDSNYSTAYVYGQDGQRSNKYTQNSETLYFNKMWTLLTDSGNNVYGGQTAKNIYLGETRIVTKLNSGENPTYQEEYYKQYYYHSDHLGSASLISDYKGDEYQRIEYTPYGETWVEKTQNTGLEFLPYRFTGKEIDEETGLYYYGARYLDPKYSRWLSTDPALGEYIPKASINEEAKRYNQNLPGMGGVFNHINGNLYHYAGNNPVRYVDPDGNSIIMIRSFLLQNSVNNKNLQMGPERTYWTNPRNVKIENTIGRYGCLFTCVVNIGNTIAKRNNLITSNYQLSEFNSGEDYFTYDKCVNISGIDCNLSVDGIKNILKDMTRKDCTVTRYYDSTASKVLIDLINKNKLSDAFIIADVGGHFINIMGVNNDGTLIVHDPYIFDTPRQYTINDLKGIYLIREGE